MTGSRKALVHQGTRAFFDVCWRGQRDADRSARQLEFSNVVQDVSAYFIGFSGTIRQNIRWLFPSDETRHLLSEQGDRRITGFRAGNYDLEDLLAEVALPSPDGPHAAAPLIGG